MKNYKFLFLVLFVFPFAGFSQMTSDELFDLLGRDLSIEPFKSKWELAQSMGRKCDLYFDIDSDYSSSTRSIKYVVYSRNYKCSPCEKILPFGLKSEKRHEKAAKKLKKISGDVWDHEIDGKYIVNVRNNNFSDECYRVEVSLTRNEEQNRNEENRRLLNQNFGFTTTEARVNYVKNKSAGNFLYVGDIGNGKCISGDCDNGKGQMQWNDGRGFNGVFKAGKPYQGDITYRHKIHGTSTCKGVSLFEGIPHDTKGTVQCDDGTSGIFEFKYGIPRKAEKLKYNDKTYKGYIARDVYQPKGLGRLSFDTGASIYFKNWSGWDVDNSSEYELTYNNGEVYFGKLNKYYNRHGQGSLKLKDYSVSCVWANNKTTGTVSLSYNTIDFTMMGDQFNEDGYSGEVVSTATYDYGSIVFKGIFKNNQPIGKHTATESDSEIIIAESNYDSNGKLASGPALYSKDVITQMVNEVTRQREEITYKEAIKAYIKEVEKRKHPYLLKEVLISDEKVNLVDWDIKKDKMGRSFIDSESSYQVLIVDPLKKNPDIIEFRAFGSNNPGASLFFMPCRKKKENEYVNVSDSFKFDHRFDNSDKINVKLVTKWGDSFHETGYKVYVMLIRNSN